MQSEVVMALWSSNGNDDLQLQRHLWSSPLSPAIKHGLIESPLLFTVFSLLPLQRSALSRAYLEAY